MGRVGSFWMRCDDTQSCVSRELIFMKRGAGCYSGLL